MKKALIFLATWLLTLHLLAQDYKANSKIEILWSGAWYKGIVKEVKDNKYKVAYDGWSSNWDEWVGKDRLRLPQANTAATTTATSNSLTVTQKVNTPALTGTTPQAGKWEATVTNGYKGDKITFTVLPNGKVVKDVAFKGYWKTAGFSGIEYVENLNPPNPFTVTNGGFSAVQQVEKARMWWEVTGHLTSATTAEGTYRAAYAGGSSDTYKLKWTAKKVSK